MLEPDRGEALMKDDALEDVRCPFNYEAELEKARYLLNKRARECVFQDRSLGYRELAMKFKVSTGTLCAIVNKKQKWQPIVRRARVKEDAFDDLQCPFNYKKELKIAREALDKKLIVCVSNHTRFSYSYRRLAVKFNLSAGTLFAIARGHKKKLKPGR